ncbi:MAG: tetratricopeptide repeat protein [Polyangiaceae bacterium]
MGIFDKWFGGGKKLGDPEELRRALFDAAGSGGGRLAELCVQNESAIFEHFPSWQKVPVELRQSPPAMQAYAQGLIGVAQHFAQQGKPELMARLMPASNPISQTQDKLSALRKRMDEGDYATDLPELRGLVEQLGRLNGTAGDRYLPITHGYVSECLFHSGDIEAAAAPAERALALCVEQHDVEGVLAYRRNLFEIARYRGDANAAAEQARLLADVLDGDNAHEASWYRAQAEIVRAGEPLNRVIVARDGRNFEQGASMPITGQVQFVFHRNRITLQPARRAIEAGERLGSEGRYLESLAAFERAAALDAFAPEPAFLSGLSLLHLKRYEEAADRYRLVEALAPGWYQCRTDRWLAERLAAGTLAHAQLLALLALSDGPATAEQKLEMAAHCLAVAPNLGLFELHRGVSLVSLQRPAEAAAAFRAGLALEHDIGTETRLLVRLGTLCSGAEQAQLFQRAIQLDGDRVSAAMARLMSSPN